MGKAKAAKSSNPQRKMSALSAMGERENSLEKRNLMINSAEKRSGGRGRGNPAEQDKCGVTPVIRRVSPI